MTLSTIFTLIFLRKDDQILLCQKKRSWGMHRWTGYGGIVEPGESIVEAAARELCEESDVNVKTSDLINVAQLEFSFYGKPVIMDVRVFVATIFEGTPQETEKMIPRWFNIIDVPYIDMWPDDKLWFPYLLAGKKFVGKFYYEEFDVVNHHTIEEQDSMEAYYENIEIF